MLILQYNKKQRWPKDFLIFLSFRKKIKPENELIWDKIKDVNEKLNVNQHEVEKVLLIFHILMENVNSEESLDSTDGVSDVVLTIVLKITELLKKNIDSLKIPEILKVSLKKIKELLNLKTEQNTNNAKSTDETKEASKTYGNGSEEHGENKN